MDGGRVAIGPEFEEWVFLRRSTLLRTAWLLCGDMPNAEDLVQTALLRCWPRWERINRMSDIDGYVTRVITNVYLSGRRRRWVAEMPTADLPEIPSSAEPDDGGSVLAALARLPRRQRATLVLRFGNDLSEEQTAHTMGCSVGTVKSQTARALRTLRVDPELLSDREPS
jgi:RNA polymerase sigma-70 factor (sigma-E family)